MLSNGGCKCRVGLPQIRGPCRRVGVDSCETDASLIVSLDIIIQVDVDMSGSLSGLSPYEVEVPVFDQGDAEMIEPTFS